jgi:hypothetical protein
MGSWGPGIFDNDGALDFIGREVSRLVAQIEAIFADDQRFHLDEEAEEILVPSVYVLALLCEQCHALLPEEVDSAEWKRRYVEMYDREMEEEDPGGLAVADGWLAQRRRLIEATFDRLLPSQPTPG